MAIPANAFSQKTGGLGCDSCCQPQEKSLPQQISRGLPWERPCWRLPGSPARDRGHHHQLGAVRSHPAARLRRSAVPAACFRHMKLCHEGNGCGKTTALEEGRATGPARKRPAVKAGLPGTLGLAGPQLACLPSGRSPRCGWLCLFDPG